MRMGPEDLRVPSQRIEGVSVLADEVANDRQDAKDCAVSAAVSSSGPSGGRDSPRAAQSAQHHRRQTLHLSSLAHVEDTTAPASLPAPCGYETGYQIGLTYLGLFSYNVGRRSWMVDASRTLFMSPGWEFTDEHPVDGVGHSSVLVNPSRALLDELCGGLGPNRNPAFRDTSRPSTSRLRLLTHHLLRLPDGSDDPLHKDEWVVHVLREAIGAAPAPRARPSRVVDLAKEFLHAHAGDRITLERIASAVGVSPVYLTQEFKRAEGTPLYQFQLKQRLSQALHELPHCDDITGLALDLGFSSHSHFTAAFGGAFGMTPSRFRATVGSKRFQPQGFAATHERRRWAA